MDEIEYPLQMIVGIWSTQLFIDSAPRRLGPLAGQVVRPGRGSASWLYRDFSSWGPHRAPGGPFDDWQGLGFPVGFPVGQSVVGPCRFQARESFVVTTGTKLGSSAPAIKVPKTMETSSFEKLSFEMAENAPKNVMCEKTFLPMNHDRTSMNIPLCFIRSRPRKARRRSPVGAAEPKTGCKGGSRRFHSVNQTSLHLWDPVTEKRLFSAISKWRFGGLRFQVCQEVSFWSTELHDGVDKCLVGGLALVTLGPREGAVSYSGTVPGLVGKGTPIWCLVPCLLRPPGRETLTFATFLPSFCQIKWFMPSDSELSVPGSNCWAFVDWTWTVWGRRSSDSSPWISKRRHLRHTTFYA